MKKLLFLSLLLFSAAVNAAEKPNFVLIFIDDMGYGDIGPYGSKNNPTPHLDQMAAEGMKLTSFYAAPVCSASRAQLLTGSYAPRVSVPGVFFPAGKNGLNPDEHTVADYLHELDYATACIGKWHLGDQLEFLPTRQGFDSYFGIPYSNDMQREKPEGGERVLPLMRNEKVAELLNDEGQRRVTREYTEEAVKFIEANAEGEQPFFLYLPHTAMHVPIFPHQDFVGKSENGRYGDWVAEVDWSVGQILATLKRKNVADNTLVIFTSDNGPWASKGTDGGVSGPLRGAKGGTLEGGVREPTIAWWPGKIKASSESKAISGTCDVLPTFVALAGGKLRDEIKIDGYDLSQVLLGEAEKTKRQAWYYFGGNKLQAVRSGPWKLAVSGQSIGMGFKEKPADLAKGGRLYNLEQEIGERTNLAENNPEVVARLQKMADEMVLEMASNTRPAGLAENPVTLYPTKPRAPRKKKASKAKSPSKPIDWNALKMGDVIDSAAAPKITGKAFELTCTITGDQAKGIIVAHGGLAVGYALYVKEGQAVFALRHSANDIERIVAPLAKGENKLMAKLSSKGVMELSVNGKLISKAQSALLKKQPQEDFCLGHDNANPLDLEAGKGTFDGKVSSVKLLLR